jgi:hypothetical protein
LPHSAVRFIFVQGLLTKFCSQFFPKFLSKSLAKAVMKVHKIDTRSRVTIMPVRSPLLYGITKLKSGSNPMYDRELQPGTDVMIFKIFSPKNFAKKLAFLTQNKSKLCKNLIITLVFDKNANFFVENCRKSQKIVILTSVPG